MRRFATTTLIVVLFAGLARATDITVENVIQLKQLGFGDDEVKSEIERQGAAKYDLNEDDVRKLKEAGAGEDLLDFMRGPEKKPLTIEGIAAMVKGGHSTPEILRAISEAEATYVLTSSQALDLSRQGVPQAIMIAIKGKPLGYNELKRLAGDKLGEQSFIILASIVGFETGRPTAGEALELLQAGVPNSIVAMFREGKKPDVRTEKADGLQEYRHVGKQFTLRFPADWRVVRSLDEGTVTYAATPEKRAVQADELDVCFEVGLLHLGSGIADRGRDAEATLQHILPLLRYDEPDMKIKGKIRKVGLGKLDAAKIRFEGKLKKKTGTFVTEIYLACQNGIYYMAVCRSPEEKYARYEPLFEQIRQKSEFGLARRSARTRAFEASGLLERYKASIVSVLCHYGGGSRSSGTGFIIHPDGYIATNAHVVLDEDGQPAQRYTVQWDQSVPRKEVEVELLGWQYGQETMFFHHSADVALLKLPDGEYTATPLTPLDDVRLGDPVVAVGFPQRFRFDTLNIFITGGVVTRFNRNREGDIDSIFTDAKIAKGSSGGPCFSLITGGVIGQNTYGMPIQVAQENARLNELVGYYGVIPVHYLMDRFPLVAELGLPMNPELDFIDSYALAGFLLHRHPGADATRLADRAVKLRPNLADAHFLQGSCRMRTKGVESAKKAFNEALKNDPDHMETLLTRCQLHTANEDVVQANQCAERSVKAHPKIWRTHFARGQLLLKLGRYDQALRAANTAKDLVHNVLAEPCILAGRIYYSKGDFDNGRREFAQASDIHPTNLAARFGIGEYFEHKENYMSALLEYGKLKQEFTNNPLVMARMGRCFKALKRWDKAVESYSSALDRAKELGVTPPEDVYFDLGYIFWNVRRSQQAIVHYGEHLAFHGRSERAYEVHMQLAEVLRDLVPERGGIPYGHLCRAWTLHPETPAIREALEKPGLRPMSLDDIVFMLNNCKYHPTVVADIVQVTKLNFTIDLDNEQHIQMLRDRNIPIEVIKAILISNLRQGAAQELPNQPAPPQQQGAQPGQIPEPPDNLQGEKADQPAQPAAAGPPKVLAALAGAWKGKTNIVFMKFDLTLTFAPNGQYTLVSHDLGDGSVLTTPGTYTATASTLTMTSEEGNRTRTSYRLAGDKLVIQQILGYIKPITFTKQDQ